MACEHSTDDCFREDRSPVETKGVDLKKEYMVSRLEAIGWRPLAFELLSSLIFDVRGRAVSTREDAWPH
jgi:hypothetical protein